VPFRIFASYFFGPTSGLGHPFVSCLCYLVFGASFYPVDLSNPIVPAFTSSSPPITILTPPTIHGVFGCLGPFLQTLATVTLFTPPGPLYLFLFLQLFPPPLVVPLGRLFSSFLSLSPPLINCPFSANPPLSFPPLAEMIFAFFFFLGPLLSAGRGKTSLSSSTNGILLCALFPLTFFFA